eukprot:4626835-Heterocapsa_arctica.AAC.1
MNMTESGDKLLEVLKVIDSHSANVAKQHYVLRDPAADVKLAKHLVKIALGETVPWPDTAELEEYISKQDGKLDLPPLDDGQEEASKKEEEDVEAIANEEDNFRICLT